MITSLLTQGCPNQKLCERRDMPGMVAGLICSTSKFMVFDALISHSESARLSSVGSGRPAREPSRWWIREMVNTLSFMLAEKVTRRASGT